MLDLTRILAGPVAGCRLAGHGARVPLVNSPKLPDIGAVADTRRGKRSAHVDLQTAAGRATLRDLVRGADVWLQDYRPGALAAPGFDDDELQRLRPGRVCVSLPAYGEHGPWGGRRGFDSLVQTATGFNDAEAQAFGSDAPRALPLQVLDCSAGFLVAWRRRAAPRGAAVAHPAAVGAAGHAAGHARGGMGRRVGPVHATRPRGARAAGFSR